MLDEVKRSLKIDVLNYDESESFDDLLNDFINRVSARLAIRINETEVPIELRYIVVEATISRFNRLGNEGMETYTQEGENIKYTSIFAEFENDIETYLASKETVEDQRGSGKVRFL